MQHKRGIELYRLKKKNNENIILVFIIIMLIVRPIKFRRPFIIIIIITNWNPRRKENF